MAVFEYTALDTRGKKKSGIIDAESLLTAKTKLREQGLYPSKIEKLKTMDGKASASGAGFQNIVPRLSFARVPAGELVLVTRQLATLLSAGFPLVHAISTIIVQVKSQALIRVLSRVKDSVQEGSSFSAALGQHPGVFSSLYVNMVHAGESSGTLDIVLERLADVAEHSRETKKKIQSAMAYPLFMALVGLGVLLILLAYVVPGIVDIFTDMEQTLPAPTLILIGISNFFRIWWWFVVSLPVLACAGFFFLHRHPTSGMILDKAFIRLPLAGSLIQKNIAARFARTLGSLMENGVPLLTGLGITKTIVGNRAVVDVIAQAADRVEQGGQVSDALENSRYFPYMGVQMVKIGETSGKMEKMLEKMADIYEKEVELAVTTATSLIEPVIILCMGLVVGAIIMAICLPIFDMNQLIG